MDILPPELIVGLLSRLTDYTEIARFRTISKLFNSLAGEIRSVHLQYTHERYLKAETKSKNVTPFKKMFVEAISSASSLIESVKIGVENPRSTHQSKYDDLFLTNDGFLILWLPKVCKSVKSISITDYWPQSSKKKSNALSLISDHCENLLNLEIKNARLSMQKLKPMQNLASLTLDHITLEARNMFEINNCFPNLRILSLVEVSGVEVSGLEASIHLLNLKTLHWKILTNPLTVTIIAPILSELTLECPFMLKKLVIESPLVSSFKLIIQDVAEYKVKEFSDLKTLYIESSNICNSLSSLSVGTNIQTLTLESSNITNITPVDLVQIFPNMTSLTLKSGFWFELEMLPFSEKGPKETNVLKEFNAYIKLRDIDATISYIYRILDLFPSLLRVSIHVHCDGEKCERCSLVSRCVARISRVEWRFGLW